MWGETGIANSTITAMLQGGRAMTRRISRPSRALPHAASAASAGQRPRGAAAPSRWRQTRTGGRALQVQDRAGRPPAKKRARHKRTKITVAEDRSDSLVSNLDLTAKATSELVDGERRLPGPAGGERESGDGTAA